MDKNSYIKLIKSNFEQFRKMLAEIRAYEMTFTALKIALEPNYPGYSKLADEGLAASRESSVLADLIRKQLDEPLEMFLQQVSEAATQEEVEKLLPLMPVSKLVN